MSSKTSSSLKELKGLREAVLAEEKAKTQALLQNLPQNPPPITPVEPLDSTPSEVEPQDQAPPSADDIDSALPPPVSEEPIAVAPSPNLSKPSVTATPTVPAIQNNASKEAALTIPLTPKIQERLQRHVEQARWSPAELVTELIRVSLHQGYPTIQYGDQIIARAGTFRTFERNPLENDLKIISGQGVFNVGVRPQNTEYQHWLSYFSKQNSANPETSASQVCLFALQSYLESIEDFKVNAWTKTISTDAFSVAPFA